MCALFWLSINYYQYVTLYGTVTKACKTSEDWYIQSQTSNRQYHQSIPWHLNSDGSGGREWSSENGRKTRENGHSYGEFSRTLVFRGSESPGSGIMQYIK